MLVYRTFRLDGTGTLYSPYARHLWTGTGNRAECQQENQRLLQAKGRTLPSGASCPDPPMADCWCGFYAYPSFQRAVQAAVGDQNSTCVGLVRLWGRVIEHTDRILRGQHCDLVALAVIEYLGVPDPKTSLWPVGSMSPKRIVYPPGLVHEACQRLGIPGVVVNHAGEAEAWLQLQETIYRANHDDAPAGGGQG